MQVLDEIEARVLGALIEKDITTPEYYPLSLNALVNACNQKSNRDPVMTLNEDDVRGGLSRLEEKNLAGPAGSEGRVMKYEHRVYEVLQLGRPEVAILCELMLRGAQTVGELRGRADRMHHFDGLEQVQSTLQKLIDREPPLVKVLPRKPGTKEPRNAQLLTGDIQGSEAAEQIAPRAGQPDAILRLETEIAELRARVAKLEAKLGE